MHASTRQVSNQTRQQNVTPQNLVLSNVKLESNMSGRVDATAGLFNEDLTRTICMTVSATVYSQETGEAIATGDQEVCVEPGGVADVEFTFTDLPPGKGVDVCAELSV